MLFVLPWGGKTHLPFWSTSLLANTISEAILSEMNGCTCALVESPAALLLSLMVESPLEVQHCCLQGCPGVVVPLHPCSSSVHHLLCGTHCLRRSLPPARCVGLLSAAEWGGAVSLASGFILPAALESRSSTLWPGDLPSASQHYLQPFQGRA